MTATKTKPYVIVVGIDFQDDGGLALDSAIELAHGRADAEVHAVFVGASVDATALAGESDKSVAEKTQMALDRIGHHCGERLKAVQARIPELSFRRLFTHLRIGLPADQIVQLSVDLDADAIVVGTHNRKGIKRLVMGSVAERVAHVARCPVFIVRPKEHAQLSDVPEIEPPCPDCVAKQMETEGAELWCERHATAKYHPRAHHYSYRAGHKFVGHGGAEGWNPVGR